MTVTTKRLKKIDDRQMTVRVCMMDDLRSDSYWIHGVSWSRSIYPWRLEDLHIRVDYVWDFL
jgi:hypothetical protein